jgi:hypothetical protein
MKISERFCKNPSCKVNTFDSLHSENISEIYAQAETCDTCFAVVQQWEEGIFHSIANLRDMSLLSKQTPFKESLDLDTAERMEALPTKPLPLYLKNYMEMSFQKEKSTEKDSIVIKIAREGVKFLNAILNDSQLELIPALLPSTRSKEKEFEESLNLKDNDIVYQVIKESKDEAYLCININGENKFGYYQVNLKKNNRFIYSSQVNERGIVSFSGLKDGKYTIEFLGKNSTKTIDLTILIDQN